MEPTVTTGSRGQFVIAVDGKTVVERKGGLIALLTRRPWPSEESILQAVAAAAKV